MLAIKLVRLIETHCEALSFGLTEQLHKSPRTTDFRRIPRVDLQMAAGQVYRNLGEWLLQKTEGDIARHFKGIATQRADQGISLHQLIWALMLTRDHIRHFLRREGLADNIVALHGEIELQQLLDQFFDRAVYYAVLGYEEATREGPSSTRTPVPESVRRAIPCGGSL
jgi:hypothetical protein